MDKIRQITKRDHPAIALYWALAGHAIYPETLYPDLTSYAFERDGELLYAVATHHVKGLPLAYVEGLIRNPNKKPDFEALQSLQAYLEARCDEAGISRLYCGAKNERLFSHYEKLGYNMTTSGVCAAKDI